MAKTHEQNKLDVAEAFRTILNSLNGGNQKDLAAAANEVICREHPTLQQALWSMMIKLQQAYAETARVDGRNELAVEWVKQINDLAVKNNRDFGLPMI